jgi:hypothetical protein
VGEAEEEGSENILKLLPYSGMISAGNTMNQTWQIQGV